jgi:hypothetical protein
MYFVAKRKWTGISLRAVGLLGILALLLSLGFTALKANADAGITLVSTTLRLSEVPVVSGTGYTANERIDLWLTGPDSSVKAYGYAYADPTGNFSDFSYVPPTDTGLTWDERAAMSTDMAGVWYITARGDTSGMSSIASFTVVGATLAASVSNVIGDMTTITYSGENYFAGENVSLWLTDATGKVLSLGNAYATNSGTLPSLTASDGTLITTLTFANDGLTGPLWITAHGNSGGQTVIAAVTGS